MAVIDHPPVDTPPPAPPPPPSMADALALLDRGFDALDRAEVADGTEAGEVTVALGRLTDRLAAADARVVGRYAASAEWSADGYKSARAAVEHRCRQSFGTSQRRIKRARTLRRLPAVAEALGAGEITADAVDLLVRIDKGKVGDKLVDAQETLLEHARRLTHRQLARVVHHFAQVADPDQGDKDAAKTEADRKVHLSSTFQNKWALDGLLPPMQGAEVDRELTRLEQQLFEQDWAEAHERLGEAATAADLRRTPAQRRADALVEMARRSAHADRSGAAPAAKPLVTIHIDHHTFLATIARLTHTPLPAGIDPDDWQHRLCELADGGTLHPAQAVNAALMGEVRVLLRNENGGLPAYGQTRRTFTGLLADAIRARDRQCVMPGCHLPASKCQIDHITEWHQGGTTDIDNGQTLCAFHNRWKHQHPERFRRRTEAGPPPYS